MKETTKEERRKIPRGRSEGRLVDDKILQI
jgi:hypothetical protein